MDNPLDCIRKDFAQAVRDFKNPTSLVFDSITAVEVPDVVATSGHKESYDYLAYKLYVEGLKTKVLLVDVQGEIDSLRRQELLQLLERELSRLKDLKYQLWGIHQSADYIQSVMKSQPANSLRVYDTGELIDSKIRAIDNEAL